MKIRIFSLTIACLAIVLLIRCNKKDFNAVSSPDDAARKVTNTKEKPLSSIQNGVAAQSLAPKPVTPSVSPVYGCGSTMSGSYNATGFYRYPDNTIDLTSTSPAATVTVTCYSYDVPDRFTVYDANGLLIGSTGWMGYATYAGPWGQSLSTQETKSITFTRGSVTGYKLVVETSVQNTSDSWDASIGCVVPSTIVATYAGVSVTYEVSNNILRFASSDDANKVMDQLETDYDTYNDNYDAQYPNYTVDQLDSIDGVNNFDEFKKLKDFEKLFPGYISTRSKVETAENNWLANNLASGDPDSSDLTFDDFMNTVFNASYSFKIGTAVYQYKPDGMYINGVNYGGGTGTGGGARGTGCITSRKSQKLVSADQLTMYKVKAAVHHIWIRGSAKGKVVAFKKKNGKFKRARLQIAANCGGNIYDSNCTLEYQGTSSRSPASGFKKRRSMKTAIRKWGPPSDTDFKFTTKHGEFAASGDTPSAPTSSVVL